MNKKLLSTLLVSALGISNLSFANDYQCQSGFVFYCEATQPGQCASVTGAKSKCYITTAGVMPDATWQFAPPSKAVNNHNLSLVNSDQNCSILTPGVYAALRTNENYVLYDKNDQASMCFYSIPNSSGDLNIAATFSINNGWHPKDMSNWKQGSIANVYGCGQKDCELTTSN